MSEREAKGCLAGLRVVETADVSAALAGRLLADLGAEVWKVEPPGGDPSRAWPPLRPGDERRSWFFEYYNAGKRSLVADPASDADRRRLRALVASADVWLDTSGPAAPSPWGLDPAEVAAAGPRLVVASLTPFGLDGPFAAFRANDLVAQAAGGMIFTNGWPGEAPLQGYGLQAFHSGSLVLLGGVLLALLERERSGRGQLVEVSLQEATASAVEEASAAWNGERRIEIRRGSIHWTRAFAVGRCRDGYVLYCTLGDWTSMHEWMKSRGCGEPLSGPEWDEFPHRREHAEELFAELDRFVADQSAAEVLEMAQALRLPFAEVRPPESLRDDPQLAARGFFAPLADGVRFPGPPFRLSATPLRTRAPAPAPGSSRWPEEPAAAPAAIPGPRSGRALDGVRVLDFTHVVAGPVATRILADHGAEVLKVERRVTLDLGDRRRGFFSNLNRGKKSLILNMADPRGVDLARRLAAACDVVIDNFSARVMGNWGLDYEGLRKLRPDVIAVGMSGFGKTGPHRDYVSFGPTLHALAGYTRIMRHPGGEPAGWGYSYSDMAGGLNGAAAVVAALVHRARTGEGQFVDLSQYESVATLLGPVLLSIANDGAVPEPAGNASQAAPAAPHGVYRCAGDDRWVAIAIEDDREWSCLADAVGEAWAGEERFARAESRLRHRADLDEALGGWTRRRSPEEVTALLQSRGVAAFTVANGEDLCARDPHLQMRGYWVRVPVPGGGFAVLDGAAARLSATPAFLTAPGPLHGEHTEAVLRDVLGLPQADLDSLRHDGVVA